MSVGRIKVLFVIMAALLLMLHVTGTFSLMADLWRIARRSETSFLSTTGIAAFCKEMQVLANRQMIQMFLLVGVAYVLLQTLCIPGTVVLNAVAGAVFGMRVGVPYCTVLGLLGACCCYALSSFVGVRLVERIDGRLTNGKGLQKIRLQVQRYRSELLVYLIFLRLTPVFPNWLLNLASPIVGVPLRVFLLSTALGIFPQTYFSVRFGVFARASVEEANGVVTLWDTLLLLVIGGAVLVARRLQKRFGETNTPDVRA